MNFAKPVFAAFLLTLIAQPALAQGTRVATVDFAVVIDRLDEKTALDADLQQMADDMNQQTEQRRADLTRMRDQLGVLAPDSAEFNELRDQLQLESVELQAWDQFRQARLGRELAMQLEYLYRKIVESIGDYAQANEIDLVIYYDSTLNLEYESPEQLRNRILQRQVVWASDDVDITDALIESMNNRFRNGG